MITGKEEGSIADVLTAGICIFAMTIIMAAYLGSIRLFYKKADIRQIARKYILSMETNGFLTEDDRQNLEAELTQLDVEKPDLSESTLHKVTYGSFIRLVIKGEIAGESMYARDRDLFGFVPVPLSYSFEERMVSTAKN